MPKQTVKEAIIAALKKVNRPLSSNDIYDTIMEHDFYRFRAERPPHIVLSELRRHCVGLDYPSASAKKHYQILKDGTYWIKDVPVPGESIEAAETQAAVKKSYEVSKDVIRNLKDMHQSHIEKFKLSILNQLKELEPDTFEHFSKKLLEVYGFKDMKVTQKSRDGGIDGFGKLKIGITHLNVAFQSKRWKNNTVRKKEIQSFRGDIQGKFEQGIFFTTALYSRDAKEISIQSGAVPIILIDGPMIVDIMIEKKFGVVVMENLPVYINAFEEALDREKVSNNN
jgi:restriction system protein